MDDSIGKLQPQKAATPVAGRLGPEQVHDTLTYVRPNAVVEERTCADRSDINEQYVSALKHCANATNDTSESVHDMPSYEVTTGNAMIDQFEPNFFGKAFPFLLPTLPGDAELRERERRCSASHHDTGSPRLVQVNRTSGGSAVRSRLVVGFRDNKLHF